MARQLWFAVCCASMCLLWVATEAAGQGAERKTPVVIDLEGVVLLGMDPTRAMYARMVVVAIDQNRSRHESLVSEDGWFVLRGMVEGHYILSVLSPDITFRQIEVWVSPKYTKMVRAVERTEEASVLTYPPLRIVPRGDSGGRVAVFEQPEGIQWKGILQNPFALMIGIGVLLMILMRNVSPQTMKEMKDSMRDLQRSTERISTTVGTGAAATGRPKNE